ncbi:hypothetical protein [Foetidibacter luteolus]|uniref:hypothetical protein n=1 Tax=Foetidibacter luteolus TaxID=2608880 RepID=UPI00129A5D10|nr:hypothetical protein [Foetidibacter luteolus]
MNKLLLIAAAMFFAHATLAQSDSTQKNEPDTIRVGNFIIVKKNKKKSRNDDTNYNSDTDSSFNIQIGKPGGERRRYRDNISTNWFIFDFGFNNWNDRTNYGSGLSGNYLVTSGNQPGFTKEDFTLRSVRSMNVNIWLFMQKLNVVDHVVNLKYGLGINMYNFFYEKQLTTSYTKGPASIWRDTVLFSKNKLAADYITVPFMVNIDPSGGRRKGLSFSFGVSAGWMYSSRNKQSSDERGTQKISGNIGLNTWRFAYIGELGLGPVRLYGTYSINPLHKEALKQYPYAFGIRLSNW